MSRAATKSQLIEETRVEYAALEKLLAPLSPDQMTCPNSLGLWSVKDVLAHLVEWHQMLFGWYAAGQCGQKPVLPAPGYKWNQLPTLNQAIYEKHRDRSLEDVLDQLRASHHQVEQLIESLSEEDLFIAGRFSWTGNHSLSGFISANAGSHYRWARTELRKTLKKS